MYDGLIKITRSKRIYQKLKYDLAPENGVLKRKTLLWIGVSVLAIILIFFVQFNAAVPAGPNATQLVAYTSEDQVQEQVPVNVSAPYGVMDCSNRPYNYSYSFNYSYPIQNGTFILQCNLTVTNLESESGDFSFYVRIYRQNSTFEEQDQTKTIAANETASFIWNEAVDSIDHPPTCEYVIKSLPRIDKCFYPSSVAYTTREVTMNRTVLKNVTHYKEVPAEYEIRRTSFFGLIWTLLFHSR